MRTSSIPLNKKCILLSIALSFFLFVDAQHIFSSSKEKAIALLKKNISPTGLNQSSLSSSRVTDAYYDKLSGNFLVYLQQLYQGIPVFNKISVFIFNHDTLVHKNVAVIGKVGGNSSARSAIYSISPEQANVMASDYLAIPISKTPQLLRKDESNKRFVYSTNVIGADSTTTELVWLPRNNDKELKLAWNVRIISIDHRQDWFVRIDAQTGEYLDKNSLIVSEKPRDYCEVENHSASQTVRKVFPLSNSFKKAFAPPAITTASYRVYPFPLESPNFGTRKLEVNPWLKAGAGNNAAVLGWHYDNVSNFNITRGNNVWTLEDRPGLGALTGITDNSTTSLPALTFDRNLDAALNPGSTTENVKAGIDNLFYWNNIMHDISYQYGFDEAAGNFQAFNPTGSGIGNDFVIAFAEDGAGINNADFNSPPDGQSPTMRMFQWTNGLTPALHINSPAAAVNNYVVTESSINLNNQLSYKPPITANIVEVNDAGSTHQGCGTIVNAASIANNIALITVGGGCYITNKIKNAQDAGAVAVIIANLTPGPAVAFGGTDNSITIPAIMVSSADRTILKANLAGLNGTISSSGLLRDGALDNGIVAHEYTHGISSRLTGGPSNPSCLFNKEQMAEGWSDYFALMVTTNWATANATDGPDSRTLGTYALSQPADGVGIRTHPYSTDLNIDPWNYSMMATNTDGEVHTIGEIWCSAIWDMTWNIIQQDGIDADIYNGTKGNNKALRLVTEAMKYQPCSPGFLDGRDAILKADSILFNNAHKCAIWNAFARRGMGKSASQGSSDSYTDQVAANDVPLGLGISQVADKKTFANGESITYTIKTYCDCGALSNISVVDTLSPKLSYVSSSNGSVFTKPIVHFDGLDFAPGETKTFTINAVVAGSYTTPITLIDDSRDPAAYTWSATALTGSTNWVESEAHSHSASHSWFAADQPAATDFTLTSANFLPDTISTLSFWHYYETEPSFDGGVVEITTDDGASWQDLGPYMTQNPYNNTLAPTTGSVGNRSAFSGSSGGQFIQTIITLTGFVGTTARIRFRFSSDDNTAGEGWYIDDIVLKNEKGIANNVFALDGALHLSNSNTFGLFSASALPVHFISFIAQKQNQAAALHWKVSNEINISKYVVERSADGINFSPIGEVSYSNISVNEKDYFFTDNQPLTGNNYYRIAEKDLDGKSTLSVVKLVRFDDGLTVISLQPVPTYNHAVRLRIDNAGDGSFNAHLVNAVGQLVKTYNVKSGVNQLDLQNFSKGIYYLKIQLNNGDMKVMKLSIQ